MYRRKPVEVEAIQFRDTDECYNEIYEAVGGRIFKVGDKTFFRRDRTNFSKDICLLKDCWVVITRQQLDYGVLQDSFEVHGDETFKEKFEEMK